MTQIKKFAWSASSVALAALLAVTILVSVPTKTASAAVSAVNFTAPVQATNLTETWSVAFQTDNAAGLAATNTITVTFPTSFTIPASPTVTAAGGWAGATFTATTSGSVVTVTVSAGTLAQNTLGTFTIAGIKNPSANTALTGATTATATAGFAVATSLAGDVAVADATPPQVWDVAIGATPTSVPGDGASTVALTFTASNAGAAQNTGSATAQVMTIATDLGTFTAASAGGGTISAGNTALATGSQSMALDIQAGVINTTAETATLKAPNSTGTATVTVKVTPSTGGAAVTIGIRTISFTAPAALPGSVASGSITPTTAINVTTTGNSGNITATFVDANGNAPIPGATLSVNTTLGVLTAGTGVTTCTNQSCTGTLASNGQATVTLTGGGVAGTATVTFTVGGVSVSKTVVITGAVDTMTAVVQADADGAGAGTSFTNASTPGAGTFGAGGGVRISVDPKDSAGNRVPGVSPAITVSPSGCVTIGATTASTATAAATTVLTAGNGSVGATCTLTATSGTKTATATITIGAALASTSTLEITASDMSTVATQTITVTVKSSSGQLAQDGTSVTLVVSAGAVATSTVLTVDGVATFTYVSPGTAQQVNLTAVAGSVTQSKAIGVGVAGPVTPGGDGTLTTPSFGDGNVGSAVFAGGTIEQLAAQVTAAGGTAVWVQGSNGLWYRYTIGALALVNNAFTAQFEAGLGNVAVFVVK